MICRKVWASLSMTFLRRRPQEFVLHFHAFRPSVHINRMNLFIVNDLKPLLKVGKKHTYRINVGGRKRILGDPRTVSRVGRKGETKVFKYGQKSPWVPTLTELFPKIQADAGSWLGTKNALYYCAQSANTFSWVLFASSYTTATVSITPCLANAPEKCTQSGNFQFDIKSPSAGLSKRF